MQRHIPLAPERLLGSTPDPRDQSLLAKGTYISTGTACWMATAGEGRCCPIWAMVQVVPFPTVCFWLQPPCHGAGHGDPLPPPLCCHDFLQLSPKPTGPRGSSKKRQPGNGMMVRGDVRTGLPMGLREDAGGDQGVASRGPPLALPGGHPARRKATNPGKGRPSGGCCHPGGDGGGHRCCRAGRGEARGRGGNTPPGAASCPRAGPGRGAPGSGCGAPLY